VHALIDSLTWGGAESLLGDFAAGAPTAGIELSVGFLKDIDDSPSARRLEESGITPTLIGAGRLRDPGSLRRVHAHLGSVRPDVLHTHLPTADVLGGIAARRLGIPAVSTIHLIGRAATDPDGPRTVVKAHSAAIVRRLTDARVIAVSEAARQAYLRRFRERPPRVVTIHNGIQRPRPSRSREQVREELGIPPEAFLAAMVAVLREGKGHEVAVEAVSRLRERHRQLVLLVVGDGPDRERIAALAGPLGGGALLTGHRGDVPDLLAAVDALVHPTDMDAFPTILLEAAAAGLPIVATAVGGIPEIVEPGVSGFLIPAPAQAGALAEALERLLEDAPLRRRMGTAAAQRFESEFSAERWAGRLRALYDEVTPASAPRA